MTSQPLEQPQRHRWTASMIRPLADQGEGKPASFVARDVDLGSVRGDETLRISALGLYRAFINGKRVGDDLLTPGWTCYDKRIGDLARAEGEWRGRVHHMERLGSDAILYLDAEQVGSLTVRTDGETEVRVGDSVFATRRAGREHRFRDGI